MDQYSYDRRSGGGPRGGGRQVFERGGTGSRQSGSQPKTEGGLPALDVRDSAVLEQVISIRAQHIVTQSGDTSKAKTELAARAGVDVATVTDEAAIKNYYYTKAINEAIVGLAKSNGIKLNPNQDTWRTSEGIVNNLADRDGNIDSKQLAQVLTATLMQRDPEPWRRIKEFSPTGMSYDQETELAKKVNSEFDKANGDMQNAAKQADMKARRAMEQRITGRTGALPVGADFMEERYRELWANEFKKAEKAMNNARANGMRSDNMRSVSKEELETRAKEHWALAKQLAVHEARSSALSPEKEAELANKFLSKSGFSREDHAAYSRLETTEDKWSFIQEKTKGKVNASNFSSEFAKFKAELPESERTDRVSKADVQHYGNMSWGEIQREYPNINPQAILDAETRMLIAARVAAENGANRKVKDENAYGGGFWNYVGAIAGGVHVGPRGTTWRVGGAARIGRPGYGYGYGRPGVYGGSTGWGYRDGLYGLFF